MNHNKSKKLLPTTIILNYIWRQTQLLLFATVSHFRSWKRQNSQPASTNTVHCPYIHTSLNKTSYALITHVSSSRQPLALLHDQYMDLKYFKRYSIFCGQQAPQACKRKEGTSKSISSFCLHIYQLYFQAFYKHLSYLSLIHIQPSWVCNVLSLTFCDILFTLIFLSK